ncbi:hypothetical protein BC835DRAFT_1412550 [Cytidiella melzeri]|nr:hypothetical protein BC835DRAFT_1412550 [Cytidiella melzeri]
MRYEQRIHIVRSMESLIYQLIAISFLLSPSILPFACRVAFQFQYSRPRELDPNRSLRFWNILNICFNFGSVLSHATQGAVQGRAIIIDFIGQGALSCLHLIYAPHPCSRALAVTPSKMRLLLLDFAIISLNMVLISIAYETTLQAEMPTDAPDPLLPIPLPSLPTTNAHPIADWFYKDSHLTLDLRFSQVVHRLRNPPPPPPQLEVSASDFVVTLPTSPWSLPGITNTSLTLMMGARIRAAARARARARAIASAPERAEQASSSTAPRTVPGGLESLDAA